jgi:hypothetical protein
VTVYMSIWLSLFRYFTSENLTRPRSLSLFIEVLICITCDVASGDPGHKYGETGD